MIPTQSQFDLLYSDYQQLDTPERFGQYIFNRTGFEIKGSYNETDTQAAWYMLRRAVMINQLTPASDWVKCSERMPELDDVKSPLTEYFVVIASNDGDEVQRAYFINWSSNKSRWVSRNGLPISAKVTHWMLIDTPAPPQD